MHSSDSLTFAPADLEDQTVVDFLEAHLADLSATSPPESIHALDLDGLRAEGVRVWAGQLDGTLVALGALSPLEDGHEELKSMRVDPAVRGRHLGRRLLEELINDAASRGITRLSLETGSQDFFAPARNLYRSVGFAECEPFGTYALDPHSDFFTKVLSA